MIYDELREFFKRYEILNWQVVPVTASHQQVLWALSHRFFLPWIALRIAFRLSDDTDVGTMTEDCWFMPACGQGLRSCVTTVIDHFIRHKDESCAELARRLFANFPRQKRDTHAKQLEGDLSKYSKLKSSPSDTTIGLLVKSTKTVRDLRLILVVARFIDRSVRHALTVFRKDQVLELLRFFGLCLSHFRGVLNQVRSEIPAHERDKVWLRLSSRTYMGATPGQQERFYPLMDQDMNELPRKINAELRRSVRTEDLCLLPRDEPELNAGDWQSLSHVQIPEEIEGAPHRATVTRAVEISRHTFCGGHINIPQARRALQRFIGMSEGRHVCCTVDDAALAGEESTRLFRLIYKQSPSSRRSDMALEFLKYLLDPYRPKSNEDRKLARELFTVASTLLRRGKLRGAVDYLRGCLHLHEGNHRKALECFVAARRSGRESCGRFWIDLLRHGLMTAEDLSSTRERKNFEKHARLFGVFSHDATPRTNQMKAQMKEDEFRQAWTTAFRPFPRPSGSKRPADPRAGISPQAHHKR